MAYPAGYQDGMPDGIPVWVPGWHTVILVRALRNDKSQRVFLAGAEAPKLRWIYDTAAAKTLASSDIKLAKT